jgi:hypothetical protein
MATEKPMNPFRHSIAWSLAKPGRFVAIWGMAGWGGVMILWNLQEMLAEPIHVLIEVPLLLLAGAAWGAIMWFPIRAIVRHRRAPDSQGKGTG